jgi:hypothetical protein
MAALALLPLLTLATPSATHSSTMAALALLPLLALATPSATPFCAFEDALFPPYYVAYKTAAPPKIDGVLDEPEWAEVEWTTPNRDICGPSNCSHGVARFGTKQKVRWDDEFLYVAAFLVSLSPAPQLLLGPTQTRHCQTEPHPLPRAAAAAAARCPAPLLPSSMSFMVDLPQYHTTCGTVVLSMVLRY